jgi:hypothetical protein
LSTRTVREYARRLNTADLTLNAAELEGSRHRVYYFGDHFEKKCKRPVVTVCTKSE